MITRYDLRLDDDHEPVIRPAHGGQYALYEDAAKLQSERDSLIGERARFCDVVEKQQEEINILRSKVASATNERDALAAEVEGLRADAARYRWLRDCGEGNLHVYRMDDVHSLLPEELDIAIDAAMSDQNKGKV